MRSIDPAMQFDHLPPMIQVSIIVTLINSEDQTDLLMFYGRYIQQMTLESLADRLQISKQRVSVRLHNLHKAVRGTYEKIMEFPSDYEYSVSTIPPEEGFRVIHE